MEHITNYSLRAVQELFDKLSDAGIEDIKDGLTGLENYCSSIETDISCIEDKLDIIIKHLKIDMEA